MFTDILKLITGNTEPKVIIVPKEDTKEINRFLNKLESQVEAFEKVDVIKWDHCHRYKFDRISFFLKCDRKVEICLDNKRIVFEGKITRGQTDRIVALYEDYEDRLKSEYLES